MRIAQKTIALRAALISIHRGERFSGAALLRASGLIAPTCDLASSVGPTATGIVMQYVGAAAMTVVL